MATEMEEWVIIPNNDLLFHLSAPSIHLLKVITFEKKWKGALNILS